MNGTAGIVVARNDRPVTIMGFTVKHRRITEIDILADSVRLRQLDLTALAWDAYRA